MALYKNLNATSGVESVEFIPRPDSNVAFFYLRDPGTVGDLKDEFAKLGQEVLGESKVNGKFVLITRGTKTEDELRDALKDKTGPLELVTPKKEFHPWEWRGHFSDVGQGLTLASAKFESPAKTIQEDKLAFAALNLSANWVNKSYGAQKTEDVRQLGYLKSGINDIVRPSLIPGTALPAVEDSRKELRSEPARPKSIGDKFNDFMKENSVRLGEIGLRYMGSIALVLSYPQFKRMGEVWEKTGGKEKLVEKFKWDRAWEAMKSKPGSEVYGLLNKNKTLRYTGGIYLVGKTLGLLLAKVPDDYDTKPKSTFDTFREKYAFRLSSAIETVAAATLAVGSFRKKEYLGAVGGTALTAGLVTRFFAPFGVRQVDHKELDAHIVDSLAMVEPEKRAQALAQVSSFLKEHFNDPHETYGGIFTRLKDKLYHDRGIALYSEPAQQPAQQAQSSKLSDKLAQPDASFAARVQREPQATVGIH